MGEKKEGGEKKRREKKRREGKKGKEKKNEEAKKESLRGAPTCDLLLQSQLPTASRYRIVCTILSIANLNFDDLTVHVTGLAAPITFCLC